MTPKERDFVAALCAARAGLSIETERPYLIENRLAVVARREGFGAIAELVRALRDRAEERLVWEVVEALAPAQTGFFRDPQVFDALADHLEEGVARRGSMRVWSAACGAGQEAYSLAMLLEERGVEDVELLASDIGQRLLEKAQTGTYSHFEVQQGLSARRLVRHFRNDDEAFTLDADLQRPVRWRRMNLLETPVGVGIFDVILCRYVLGTLLAPARERALANVTAALRPGGRVVLGIGETPSPASGLAPVAGVPGVFELPSRVRSAA